MAPEIHGALLGGLLAGATVVLGVALTEWLNRLRARRRAIEDATHRLSMTVPYVTIAFLETAEPVDRSAGGRWAQANEDVIALTSIIRRSARWPLRRAKKIRAEVDDLPGRIFGAERAADFDGIRLTRDQFTDVSTLGLSRAVYGEIGNLDELTEHYRTNGPTPRPDLDD